jgi:hypothetical protein
MRMPAVKSVIAIAIGVWLIPSALAVAQSAKQKPGQKVSDIEPPSPSIPVAPTPAQQPPRPTPVPNAAPPKAPLEPSKEVEQRFAGRIRDLDATEFLTRETAMLQLLEAGPAVLPALQPVLTGGSLEATSRALFIVRQVGLAADLDGQDQAGQLLAELAERKEAPALARRAAAALVELTQQRSVQALTELEQLGARIARSQGVAIFALDEPPLSIEIGEAFRGDENDLRRLKWIIDVPILILNGKHVTDAWVKEAVALPGLAELHLYQARISDTGLAPLAEHPGVRQVGLYHTAVHDAVLAPLAKLPLLSFVKLYGTQVTKEGVAKLSAASGVAVDLRRGAFLGVGGHDEPEGCRIITVHRGSPAHTAGILPGDIVTKFGGAPVVNFSGLTDLIAPHEFGDEVEVELGREDLAGGMRRSVTVKVTLGGWEVEQAVLNNRPR